jgi:hypothetical protein
MAQVTCPECHNTQAADDFCIKCGAEITPGAAILAPSAPAAPSASAAGATGAHPELTACPDCAEARIPGARVCIVCRYNFETMQSFTADAVDPNAAPTAPVAPSTAAPAAAPAPSAGTVVPVAPIVPDAPIVMPAPNGHRVEALIELDRSLDMVPNDLDAFPSAVQPVRYELGAEMLVGRRRLHKNPPIIPNIPVDADVYVSGRHATLRVRDDGAVTITPEPDTNGTFVRTVTDSSVPLKDVPYTEIPPGTTMVLEPTMVVSLGRWTKLTIHAV